MATKMCFAVGTGKAFEERIVEFEYIKGMAFSQKQKNVLSFHKSISEQFPGSRIIEISTKSQTPIGVNLSAFNLKLDGFPLECVFQSSKVFEGGVQYKNLLYEDPKSAKQFIRDNVSLPLVKFNYNGEMFEISPRTMFYDYIYISALLQSDIDAMEIARYDIFTDIEFNEKKQYNCQARACAIYAYMLRNGSVEYYMSSKEKFKELYFARPESRAAEQLTLLF
jgi:type I restriction enzyme M protein